MSIASPKSGNAGKSTERTAHSTQRRSSRAEKGRKMSKFKVALYELDRERALQNARKKKKSLKQLPNKIHTFLRRAN